MHVDLIEALRCPRGHADGWLVVAADQVADRRIMRGTIGCPECGAEWIVTDGALRLVSDDDVRGGDTRGRAEQAGGVVTNARPAMAPAAGPDAGSGAAVSTEALRTAALLDLTDARGVVLLAGEHARLADALHRLSGVLVVAVNPPAGVATAHSRLHAGTPLPLGVGTMRGAALDGPHADAAWLASAVRVVQKGGRIIAPVHAPLPGDLHELARDEREWVADVQLAASGLVPLRRGGDPMA